MSHHGDDPRWEYQFFPTPEGLAEKLVELAEIGPTDIVLEPSAGRGGLLDAIASCEPEAIEVCELMPENRHYLEEMGHTIVAHDFLSLRVYARYTRIVANPPFTRDQDIRHIKHMYELLRFGGRMVAVMSAKFLDSAHVDHVAFRQWLSERSALVQPMGEDAFAELGIDVATAWVMIEK